MHQGFLGRGRFKFLNRVKPHLATETFEPELNSRAAQPHPESGVYRFGSSRAQLWVFKRESTL